MKSPSNEIHTIGYIKGTLIAIKPITPLYEGEKSTIFFFQTEVK